MRHFSPLVYNILLTDFDFMFLLFTFNLIFTYTDPIFSIIQTKLCDIAYCNDRIISLLNRLKKFRNDDSCFKNIYSKLFFEILDIIINQIEIRFKDISSLSFLELTDHSKFDAFNRNFPEKQLVNNYQGFFNNEKLKRELQILYSDKFLFGNSEKITEMIKFIYDNDIITDVPESYKLFSLIVSLPPTSACVERSFSALKRIKSYTRNKISQSRLNNLSLLAIERGLLKQLMKDDSFYDK
ncbi:hypothetical protein NQ315_004427, partial [Exocentrus adspersus]